MQFQVRPPPPPPPPGEGGRGALRGFCLVLYKTRRVTLLATNLHNLVRSNNWFRQTKLAGSHWHEPVRLKCVKEARSDTPHVHSILC